MRTSSSLLSRFETFSRKYAEGVTAFVGLLGLLLAVATLIFLYRDYSLRYRPYVVPGVVAENFKDKPGLLVNIKPTNVGSYPCYVKITNIWLQIGDEKYQTPDMDDWLLLGPQGGVGFAVPAGHVNETGVKNVRESRYARNRIDLCFDYSTMSAEKRFLETKRFCTEINVLGETPQVLFRPSGEP